MASATAIRIGMSHRRIRLEYSSLVSHQVCLTMLHAENRNILLHAPMSDSRHQTAPIVTGRDKGSWNENLVRRAWPRSAAEQCHAAATRVHEAADYCSSPFRGISPTTIGLSPCSTPRTTTTLTPIYGDDTLAGQRQWEGSNDQTSGTGDGAECLGAGAAQARAASPSGRGDPLPDGAPALAGTAGVEWSAAPSLGAAVLYLHRLRQLPGPAHAPLPRHPGGVLPDCPGVCGGSGRPGGGLYRDQLRCPAAQSGGYHALLSQHGGPGGSTPGGPRTLADSDPLHRRVDADPPAGGGTGPGAGRHRGTGAGDGDCRDRSPWG